MENKLDNTEVKEIESALIKGFTAVDTAYEEFLKSIRKLTSTQMYRVLQIVLAYPNLKAITLKSETEKNAVAAGMTLINSKLELTKVSYLHDILVGQDPNSNQPEGGENE
jgi:hypothetical protein